MNYAIQSETGEFYLYADNRIQWAYDEATIFTNKRDALDTLRAVAERMPTPKPQLSILPVDRLD